MTQLGEMVAVIVGKDDEECPFPHREKQHKKKNKMNNDSTTLKENLASESANGAELILPHIEETTIGTGSSGKKNYTMTYNPHHIMPGNAAWPETALLKWIDKKTDGTMVKGDIGYDVNGYLNGIDLPSSNYLRGNWTNRSDEFQNKYAIASIEADGGRRQFHDSHAAYSDFAKEVLDKMAAKLDARPRRSMGCGDEKCCAGSKKPFAPPYAMKDRIESASQRLANKLHGDCTRWELPIMTSKFSLIYKTKMTHKEAVAKLKPENFKY